MNVSISKRCLIFFFYVKKKVKKVMKKINKYKEMKDRHQQEFNKFPIMFAFNDEQFKEGIKKLKLDEKETDKLLSIGAGGFIRKKDTTKFYEMMKKFDNEFKQLISEDKTGNGFIKDMFVYEMINHEYSLTLDLEDTLQALNLTTKEISQNENLENGLKLAKQEILKEKNLEEELFD